MDYDIIYSNVFNEFRFIEYVIDVGMVHYKCYINNGM